jgi:predicted nucleic acid-binding protein
LTSGAGVLYVATSALVKLVILEPESDALEEELRDRSELATSVIASIEFSRAVSRARTDSTAVVADEYTILGLLASLAEVPLNDDVRAAASSIAPVRIALFDGGFGGAGDSGPERRGLYGNFLETSAEISGV